MARLLKIIQILEPVLLIGLLAVKLLSRLSPIPLPSEEALIDITVILLAVLAFIRHSSASRLYWYGYFLLILTAALSIIGFQSFASFTTGLVLGVFLVAFINQVVFAKKD